jgi:rubrerythrin
MEFKDLNAIIDFAIEKEKEAADFYDTVGSEERMSGKKKMFKEFAAEERKHRRLLEKFKAEGIDESIKEYKLKWITDIKRSNYVDDVEYRKGMPYNEMLMMAMKREEKALKLYNEMLGRTEDSHGRKVLKILCQEEAKHKLVLETMYDDFMAEMGD